jgi:hypothetical protein
MESGVTSGSRTSIPRAAATVVLIYQFEFRARLQWIGSAQNAIDIACGLPITLIEIGNIGH